MDAERYAQWIKVWDWFRATDRAKPVSNERWDRLYTMLNSFWLDERQNTPAEQLTAFTALLEGQDTSEVSQAWRYHWNTEGKPN